MTTNGRVFVGTKAEINRLEALRKVMAERSYRMLCKGALKHDVKLCFCQSVHVSRGRIRNIRAVRHVEGCRLATVADALRPGCFWGLSAEWYEGDIAVARWAKLSHFKRGSLKNLVRP